MRKTVVIILAEGFEEIEAVTPIDVLRRAGVEVITAGLGKRDVKSSRGIPMVADVTLESLSSLPDMVILPGGLPGAENLKSSTVVSGFIQKMKKADRWIAAICASPGLVLAKEGVLDGKKATCYPGYEKDFPASAQFSEQAVVSDGKVVTSRGPGTAFAFSFELVKILVDEAMARKLKDAMLV